MNVRKTKSILYGICAISAMLAIYFAVLSLVSGFEYAKDQFADFWKYIVSLALGFGIQVGLYTYLKSLIHGTHGAGKVLGVTGTTSTVAMISCCAHYLTNLLPVLGAVGIVTILSQYQVEFFWIGLLFNLAGTVFIVRRIIKVIQV